MRLITNLVFLFFLLLSACRKKDVVNPCEGKTQPVANFTVKEVVGDTAFTADTIFRDNPVQFAAAEAYDSVQWKIGTDTRIFTKPLFHLNFVNDLITVAVKFTGYRQPATNCFPDDKGIYTGTKSLTAVEQFDRATLTKSPLIGCYRGAFTDAPSDTFTVRIDYFDSAKYNTSITGIKNFYWISNLPKGYRDSTSDLAHAYPELRNGLPVEMGYKALKFGWSASNCNSGYAWLSHDTLYITRGNNFCGRKKFIGRKL